MLRLVIWMRDIVKVVHASGIGGRYSSIVTSLLKETWNHTFRALTGILVGWTSIYLCYLLLRPAVAYVLADTVVHSRNAHILAMDAVRLLIVLIGGQVSGRTVRLFARANGKPVVLAYAISVLLASAWVTVNVLTRDWDLKLSPLFWPMNIAAVMWFLNVLHGGRIFSKSSGASQAG